MYAAAAPSPAPASPWQPAHHFTYTRLPAVVSCAARERGAGSGTVPAATTSVTRSRSARSVMTAPCLTAPCSLSFLPRPRLPRSEEHTSELQSLRHLVCRLLLEKKKKLRTTR